MRAREWKLNIEKEKDRLLQSAETERKIGDGQKRLAYEKAGQYETTAASLARILDAAEKDSTPDDENGEDGVDEQASEKEPVAETPKRRGRPPKTPKEPAESPQNELVGEGAGAF